MANEICFSDNNFNTTSFRRLVFLTTKAERVLDAGRGRDFVEVFSKLFT